jgi:hypothetical protein
LIDCTRVTIAAVTETSCNVSRVYPRVERHGWMQFVQLERGVSAVIENVAVGLQGFGATFSVDRKCDGYVGQSRFIGAVVTPIIIDTFAHAKVNMTRLESRSPDFSAKFEREL